jgi:DNA-binding Lrp family transcriptional regulator
MHEIGHEIDRVDAALLNAIQERLPVSATPFADLGRTLDLSEEEVITRLAVLKEHGYIRRIGAVFDSKSMGFFSTLCACRVEDHKIEEAAAIINAQPGVTHNYVRDNDRNIWFTLTAPSKEAAVKILKGLEAEIGSTIDAMPARKVYKIKVSLAMGDRDGGR